jgi:hypothetical protein
MFNFVEQNYITTKRKALVMVYALQKFRHYMLDNNVTFFVDHTTLIYLVNKPQVYSRLAKWFLLFMEYDFKIDYKLSGWRTPKLLNKLKCKSEVKTTEEQIVGAHSLAHNTLGVEGHSGAQDETRKNDK